MKYEILMEKCLHSTIQKAYLSDILFLISYIYIRIPSIIPKHFQKVNCMFSENRDKTKITRKTPSGRQKNREIIEKTPCRFAGIGV